MNQLLRLLVYRWTGPAHLITVMKRCMDSAQHSILTSTNLLWLQNHQPCSIEKRPEDVSAGSCGVISSPLDRRSRLQTTNYIFTSTQMMSDSLYAQSNPFRSLFVFLFGRQVRSDAGTCAVGSMTVSDHPAVVMSCLCIP